MSSSRVGSLDGSKPETIATTRQAADCGVIAKTLHEAADQHHVDELLVGAGPIRGLSQFKGLLVQFVELVVVDDDLFGGLGVAVGTAWPRSGRRRRFRNACISANSGWASAGGGKPGECGGRLRRVTGQIAHTFEGGGQTHGGNNHAQIRCNRVSRPASSYALIDNAPASRASISMSPSSAWAACRFWFSSASWRR